LIADHGTQRNQRFNCFDFYCSLKS
jgi:hypothetical protein